ncbi:CPBP family intramembrane metalloprotease [Nostocaceae cyanobacterium CENA357]|uniref:CPBP family intramembrane metalloprotease n=1 Tax=Atlanticothrix silvestris CENA357 TaxID=1725252 RepID=A0A8J7L5E9_9CYAN|nr:type II CAAX endopeptidase family protein [Atlanticothrix silvestris]MBH8555776.1 CPBP family intramembrane metalloprotease [Atlanticothrix silvestris CENA357]
MTNQHLNHPFHRLKARNLLLRGLLITLIIGTVLGLVQGISGLKLNNQVLSLSLYFLIFGLLCLWQLVELHRLGINLRYVVGRVPENYKWLKTLGLVIIIILFSLSAYLVSFSLVSLIAPDFVERLLRQIASNPSPSSSAPLFINLLGAIAYVVFAPIAEEFLFRGIILQRWATKWGIRAALVVSSLLFGILHANVLGLTIFGLVMGVLYIKTRTLIIPITCHALNNLLAVAMGLLANPKTTSAANSLEQLRSGWWLGILLMLVSLPLLVRFLSRNWPHKDAPVPYLINASQAEN